jgi:type III pantothenate kinase
VLQVVVDVGNTSTKFAGFSRVSRPGQWQFRNIFDPKDETLTESIGEQAHWTIASVNQSRLDELTTWIKTLRPHDQIRLLSNSDIPLTINVQFPDRVGVDRLLGAWGAILQLDAPSRIIVVNVGTAVTIDLVSSDRIFQGGLIFPGPFSCFRLLHTTTEKLPLVDVKCVPAEIIGKSTDQAISSGVWQMQIGAIRHIVDEIRQLPEPQHVQSDPVVFLTGGGAGPIKSFFPDDWRYDGNLVLHGIQALAIQ